MTNMQTLIETYYTNEQGYHPFFIKDHWQVAQLNYLPEHSYDNISRLDLHEQTDEIFVLTKGQAILIAASIETDRITYECVHMKIGVTYNIPPMVWHNIAMQEDAEMIIVEKNNTHLGDFIYHPLNDEQRNELRECIYQCQNIIN